MVCQNWTKRAVSEVVMQCNEKNQRANASCTQVMVLSIFSLLPTGAKIHHTSTLLQTLAAHSTHFEVDIRTAVHNVLFAILCSY